MKQSSFMAVIAIIAAACGGGSGSPAPASPGASVAAPSVAAPSVAAPSISAEPVELTVMTWDQGGVPFWDEVARDFSAKYPNITIKREVTPYDQYVDKLGLYRTAGAGPDVLTITAGSYLLGFSDIMTPLNGLIEDPTTTSNGASGACQDFDCTKDQFGGIVTGQAHPIYFNKAVLTEAGLDPADPPSTWKEMDTACQKIKAVKKACISTGGKDFGGLTQMLALLQETSTLEQCQGLQSGTTKATDPWFVAAFALYEDMAKRGWFQEGAIDANLAPEAQDLFTSGGAGFYTGLLSEVYAWKQLGDILGDDLGVGLSPAIEQDFPLPGVSPSALSGSLDSAASWAPTVAKWTKHQAEAILLSQYLAGPEVGVKQIGLGGFPMNKEVDTSTAGSASLDTLKALAAGSKGTCWQFLDAATFGPIIAQAQLLLLGKTTPEAAGAAVEAALVDVR